MQDGGILNTSEHKREESTAGFDQKFVQLEQQKIINQEMLHIFNKQPLQQPKSTFKI